MKKKREMYAVMKLIKSGGAVSHPFMPSVDINLYNDEIGLVGMIAVYKTKTAARKEHGRNVGLIGISFREDEKSGS